MTTQEKLAMQTFRDRIENYLKRIERKLTPEELTIIGNVAKRAAKTYMRMFNNWQEQRVEKKDYWENVREVNQAIRTAEEVATGRMWEEVYEMLNIPEEME